MMFFFVDFDVFVAFDVFCCGFCCFLLCFVVVVVFVIVDGDGKCDE